MMLLAIAGLLAAGAGDAAPLRLARLSLRQRVIIRIQTARAPAPSSAWREKKGPKCLGMDQIVAAAVLAPSSVDFVLRGGDRVRARFASSCPGLDFYSGFYVTPTDDGLICTARDVVRDRAGGECAVDKFRRLVPK